METKSNYQLITIVYCKKNYGLSNVNNSTGTIASKTKDNVTRTTNRAI